MKENEIHFNERRLSMKGFRLNATRVWGFLIVILSMVLFVGCSENPMGIAPDQSEPQLLQRSTLAVEAIQRSTIPLYTERVVSAAEGGVMTLFDVLLEIPAGAVPNDTLFSISIPDINVFYNEFGTNGLVFAKPVKVTMSYRDADLAGIDESTIRIGWLNESTGQFQDIVCTVDQANKTVAGEVEHFSAYALISD
jgi:hypothetical protein